MIEEIALFIQRQLMHMQSDAQSSIGSSSGLVRNAAQTNSGSLSAYEGDHATEHHLGRMFLTNHNEVSFGLVRDFSSRLGVS
jgi:hypothetical protein